MVYLYMLAHTQAHSLAYYCILYGIVFHIIKRVKTTAIISLGLPVAERGFYRVRAAGERTKGAKTLYYIAVCDFNYKVKPFAGGTARN